MRKFAITGLARHGKDTVGYFLQKHTNKSCYALAKPSDPVCYALASPIKNLAKAFFSLTEEHVNGSLKEVESVFEMTIKNLEVASIVFHEAGLGYYGGASSSYYGLNIDYTAFIGLLVKVLEPYEVDQVVCMDRKYFSISPRKIMQILGTEVGRSFSKQIWLEAVPENAIVTDVRFDNEAEFLAAKGYEIIKVVNPRMGLVVSAHCSEEGINESLIDHYLINDGSLSELEEQVKKLLANESSFLL